MVKARCLTTRSDNRCSRRPQLAAPRAIGCGRHAHHIGQVITLTHNLRRPRRLNRGDARRLLPRLVRLAVATRRTGNTVTDDSDYVMAEMNPVNRTQQAVGSLSAEGLPVAARVVPER